MVEAPRDIPTRKVDVDPVAEALEQMPYGLYIIGSRGSEGPNGMMADWVMQVSFKPRLLAVSFENNATTLRNIRGAGVFSVNLLKSDGRELAARFCQPQDASKVQGRSREASSIVYHKLDGVEYEDGRETGCPLLGDALAWLECEVYSETEVGDHTLVVGRVLTGEVVNEGEPLTQRILGWSYAG